MSGRRIKRGRQLGFTAPTDEITEQLEDEDTNRAVAAFQEGDTESFAVLYSRYFERVYAYLRVAFDSLHEAEDATQQVFTSVFEALPRYENRGQPFRVWLFVVVRNEAITQLKRLARLVPTDPAELNISREVAALEEEELALDDELAAFSLDWIGDPDLLLFIERLPAVQRQILVLRFMFDLPNKRIATMLGRTPNDVAVLQRRALIFVRKRLHAIGRSFEASGEANMRAFNPQSRVLRERRFSLKK